MSAGTDEVHGLHVVGSRSGVPGPAAGGRPVPLQTDWRRILTDLTSLGVVRLGVGNPVVALECLAEPWRAQVRDGVGTLHGPGVDLLALVANLAGASIDNGRARVAGDHVLRWVDWSGREALRVVLTEESAWSGFHAMLVRQWAQRAVPRPVTGTDIGRTGEALAGIDARTAGDGDVADAWYLDRRSPAAARAAARAVDPTLVVPFLEALTEHACRLRVLVGNGAVLQRHESAFFACVTDRGVTRLSGSTASLSLRREEIAGAWVLPTSADARCRRVRLFDGQGRTLATLAAVDAHGQSRIWQAAVNALMD